jgi:hypothetical protein
MGWGAGNPVGGPLAVPPPDKRTVCQFTGEMAGLGPPGCNPSVGGEGSPADSDIRKSPAGERPIVSTGSASVLPVETEFDWVTWVIPAITDVLAEHIPCQDYTGIYCNEATLDGPHEYFEDWAAWREHVGPLIAQRIHSAAASQT